MICVSADNADRLWRVVLHQVLKATKAAPRGKSVQELIAPTILELTNPLKPFIVSPARKPYYRFGLVETLWMLSGSRELAPLTAIVKRMEDFSDDGRTLWGAYGPRLMGQLPHVVDVLKRDPDSRQAVLTTWRPMVAPINSDCGEDEESLAAGGMSCPVETPVWNGVSHLSKDVPCTCLWQFQLRNNRLQLTVTMRSNDLWLGFPYDVLNFTTVQRLVAWLLGVELGSYYHCVNNLHLYDKNREAALQAAREVAPKRVVELPSLLDSVPDADPVNVLRLFQLHASDLLAGKKLEPHYLLELNAAAVRDNRTHILYSLVR